MLFNSFAFWVFFAVVTTGYFALPYRWRWLFLLAASYYFYMSWRATYALLILFSTVVDYIAGLRMGRLPTKRGRGKWLVWSLVTNLGLLFFFKYYNFASHSINALGSRIAVFGPLPYSQFLLPVGISFYTFQTLSYSIEVYRGTIRPERHFGRFALYVSFFPQLVAGPIERAGSLLPQLRERFDFDYDRVTSGLKLMAWGLFKKLVIADQLAVAVDSVYGNPSAYTGPAFTFATVLFAFQIYCDFSGYSDIAIGAAEVLGIKLMQNFRQPYHAASVREFWQRWHISLSTWFRDYLYIPLGGRRVSIPRWYFNVMVVFIVSGLWHGASWTFAIWGLLHGAMLVVSFLTKGMRGRFVELIRLDRLPRLHHALRVAVTFSLVTFAWIFFRAESLSDAAYVVSNLAGGWHVIFDFAALREILHSTGMSQRRLLVILLSIGVMEAVHLFQTRGSVREIVSRQPLWLRWTAYSCLGWWIFLFGNFGIKQFIYFTF